VFTLFFFKFITEAQIQFTLILFDTAIKFTPWPLFLLLANEYMLNASMSTPNVHQIQCQYVHTKCTPDPMSVCPHRMYTRSNVSMSTPNVHQIQCQYVHTECTPDPMSVRPHRMYTRSNVSMSTPNVHQIQCQYDQTRCPPDPTRL